MEESDSFDILQPENIQFGKNSEGFSHTMCVTLAYHAAIRAGGVEMIKGFWEVKTDKFGNQMRSYHSDTRQIFINSVETLKNTLIADFDEFAKKNIDMIYLRIGKLKQDMISAEDNWYRSLSPIIKRKVNHINGYLNQDNIYYHTYIDNKVDYTRMILEQLELLLCRKKYLRKKVYGNIIGAEELGLDEETLAKINEEPKQDIELNLDE